MKHANNNDKRYYLQNLAAQFIEQTRCEHCKKIAAPFGSGDFLMNLEARAGVEPTYTDLQSDKLV
ncbi:hypothetical protein [Pigmentiphaga sp.]|uniref:hypothetical protein n=1 Tax=Pigmentiphaga sp. TaxID=1977564 RepID=UPI0025EDE67C|nr:hypothetical protein [Pigmentiphaga sp.]